MTAAVNAQALSNSSVNGQRGIASLTWGSHVLRFRTNPNEVNWSYSLITKTDQTYGGRVVQILGTKIDDLSVKIECGNGGWPYLVQIATFMRDLMIAQRNGQTATFEYTSRNWKLKVYAANFPFGDRVDSTTREITLNFKVQEDISGIVSSASIAAALQTYANGIGWQQTQYNTVEYPNSDTGLIPNVTTFTQAALPLVPLIGNAANAASSAATIASSAPSVTGGAVGGAFSSPGTGSVVAAAASVISQPNLFTIPNAY